MPELVESVPLGGSERFEIERRIGEGGMGVVYAAFDRERGKRVAIKTLSRLDAHGIYKLKQEFRALADVVHPNLVALYDLISEGGDWFFSMELIDGANFLEYLRNAEPAPSLVAPWEANRTAPSPFGATAAERAAGDDRGFEATLEAGTAPRHARIPADLSRLRCALTDLGEGIFAIHAAGKLHRDIKPNNVLVTPDGRVVVLDLGLVQERDPDIHADASLDQNMIVGTPAYMAPEQAAGNQASQASDWYAVGVMIYQALTGVLPFSGSVRDVLAAKQNLDPPPLESLVDGVPDDLILLVHALLRRDPEERPGGEELLAELRAADPRRERQQTISRSARPPQDVHFMGRTRELELLDAALAATRSGRAAVLFVGGEGGMGRSTLLEHFAERHRRQGDAVVLTGRTYERESVPFKAFDALVDSLSRYLRRLPGHKAEPLLPRNLAELMRLFPVLGRVEAIQRAPGANKFDVTQARARAFDALKELFARIADRWPLVLAVDDLEWMDADSLDLLVHLVSRPDQPALLFVGGYRDEALEANPVLQRLVAGEGLHEGVEIKRLTLGPLDLDDALTLSLDLMGLYDDQSWNIAKLISRESAGRPLFVSELSRYVAEVDQDSDDPLASKRAASLSLTEALRARLERLSPGALRILRLAALAGAPLEQEILVRTADIQGDGRQELGELLSRRFVRLTRRQALDAVEIAQERLRELVVSQLTPEHKAELHAELADELAASQSGADPSLIARHYESAGQNSLAARHAERAAERATQAFAFDRSARFYELALELSPEHADVRRPLLIGLAEARAALGRTAEAVELLGRASVGAQPDLAVQLMRRAAELSIQGSDVDALFIGGSSRPSLFDGIERDRVQALLARSDVLSGKKGERIVGRGDAAHSFLVVLSGAVEVWRGGNVRARFDEGSVLGEAAFLLQGQRVADVYAAGDQVRVLAVSQHSLDQLALDDPALALKIVTNLSRIVCDKLLGLQKSVFGASR